MVRPVEAGHVVVAFAVEREVAHVGLAVLVRGEEAADLAVGAARAEAREAVREEEGPVRVGGAAGVDPAFGGDGE